MKAAFGVPSSYVVVAPRSTLNPHYYKTEAQIRCDRISGYSEMGAPIKLRNLAGQGGGPGLSRMTCAKDDAHHGGRIQEAPRCEDPRGVVDQDPHLHRRPPPLERLRKMQHRVRAHSPRQCESCDQASSTLMSAATTP